MMKAAATMAAHDDINDAKYDNDDDDDDGTKQHPK